MSFGARGLLSLFCLVFLAEAAGATSTLPFFCEKTELEKLEAQKNAVIDLRVDRIVVNKYLRRMYLLSKGAVWRSYQVALGTNEPGPKIAEGDLKTPEGSYRIDYHNPKSNFHLALHISYPNAEDRRRAETAGKKPGGNIMIHGFPNDRMGWWGASLVHPGNWTTGCVAVTNDEIREIYDRVKDGTPIDLCAGPVPPKPEPKKPGQEPPPVPTPPPPQPTDPRPADPQPTNPQPADPPSSEPRTWWWF